MKKQYKTQNGFRESVKHKATTIGLTFVKDWDWEHGCFNWSPFRSPEILILQYSPILPYFEEWESEEVIEFIKEKDKLNKETMEAL